MAAATRPTRALVRTALFLVALTATQLLSGCVAQIPAEGGPPPAGGTPFGRGVNFGNALEAPEEGWWGLTLKEAYVAAVADAGFQTVRLPVKWSGHASATPPYTIDATFLARVDEVVGWILAHDMNVILDLHHYDEMATDPEAHVERWLGIWRQLAEHHRDAPDALAFELLNEPNEALGPGLWNEMFGSALAVVRETNPARWVVVGPTDWNAIGALPDLVWPDDSRLVLTVHFYEPFDFTHQGAPWVESPPPTGRTWTGTQLAPRAGWHDWSWDTARDYGSALNLTFEAGWAGFYLQASQPVGGYTSLALTTSRGLDLIISCSDGEASTAIATAAGVEALIDLEECGAGPGGVSRLILQNGTDSAQAQFELQRLELRGPQGEMSLLTTETESIAAAFDLVAEWAAAHGAPPVLVGEFGALDTADMPSRVRWTRAVREAAEARGFGWAYWEFGAGFGVYDPATETWRQALLEALMSD